MTSLSSSLSASAHDAALRRRGLLLVAGAAIIWSSGGLIVRLLEAADAWTTIFWRCAFAALFLLAFIAIRDGRRAPGLFLRMGWAGLLVALCFATASTCLVVALDLTTVADTLVILSTSPFLAALLGWALMGERVRPRGWLAMAAALFGIVIMVSDSIARGSLAGDLVALVIPISTAVAIVTIRRCRDVRMTPATCLAAGLAALFALPLAAPLSVTTGDFGLLVLFGAGQLGVGMALFTSGGRFAPAAEVALISVLEPILGPVWVWIFLGENPGTAALVGGTIVLSALILHTAFDLRQARPIPPAV